jgi:hypothetical protein
MSQCSMLVFVTGGKPDKHMQLTANVVHEIQKGPQNRKHPRPRYSFRQLHARSCLVVFEKQQRQQADQKEA